MNLQPAQGRIELLQRAIEHHNSQTAHYLPHLCYQYALIEVKPGLNVISKA